MDRLLRVGEGKLLKQLSNIAKQVNAIEDDFVAMSDEELRGQTAEFRERYDRGEILESLLPEAFATVREASHRVLDKRHFDVQVMGGAALHMGNIAEMKTGEGKTLVATMPSYLNALTGRGVHIVTVNDYLAKRDSEWMGRIHHFLGVEVGAILSQMDPAERRSENAFRSVAIPAEQSRPRGRLVGNLTEHDVLRALAERQPAIRGGDPDNYFS